VKRAIGYLAHHAIAFTALGFSLLALAGASYAAMGLANHTIDPVKLNPRYIGGYVRAWASVGAGGRVIASGGRVRVQIDRAVGPGHYVIDWRSRPTSACRATGSVDLSGGLTPGYVIAQTAATRVRGEQSIVQTYSAQGQPAALSFDVVLLCATPR
jgi:hypothetical protein